MTATPTIPNASRRQPGIIESANRVFAFSLGQMLWATRTIFMLVVVGSPIVLATVIRVLQASGFRAGQAVGRAGVFGMMIWVLYLKFIVPVLGLFYGTSLIADEVEDRTITYLFTRPIPRGSVLIGKYLAYLVCASLVVLPSVMIVYFALVPVSEIASTFTPLLKDLGVIGLGLAVYGALFALTGTVLNRPLVTGLVFAFGWEPVVSLLPGYLKQFTIAYYLQALVPHAMPPDPGRSVLGSLFQDVPSVTGALFWLLVAWAACLWLAFRAVGRREYVLEQ